MSIKYSIVVPCYNSAPWLIELSSRIETVMMNEGESFELILINDASPDHKTWDVISELCSLHSWIIGVDMQFNTGQFKSLLAGLEITSGEFVITMDDDLQHPPEEIPKLIKTIKQHPSMDAVIGAYKSKKHSAFRNLGRAFVNKLSELLYGKPKEFSSTAFRIMTKSLVQSLIKHRTMKPVIGALIFKNTSRMMNVEVEHHSRPHGQSGYSLRQLIASTFDNVIDSTTAPLRFFGGTGIIISMASIALSIFYFIYWLLGYITSPGFITLMLLITFFGGMTLFGIGLIGEYLSRVVIEVSNAPRFVIREVKNMKMTKE